MKNLLYLMFGAALLSLAACQKIDNWSEPGSRLYGNVIDSYTGKNLMMDNNDWQIRLIDRTWENDDEISFAIPLSFRLHKYTGLDQEKTYDRYALMAGPVLMSLVGDTILDTPASELVGKLRLVQENTLNFGIDGKSNCKYIPYYRIQDEKFTCFPTIQN